ncbi:hypothetical protein [Candidatus Viridilinea mediisalina]|uniref:DUF3352 domain-containing protein n=1 Tax=Candidatus Viridilinea mediisalina TaxID=2024553 RepID=A0A2A6RJI3_9CHLR|nr:hypothetical protein [Candidatus Viridilinea mediisalina]PDW03113.1 hypothetical protein CJ255_10375 [Candidatus Viridilinea mediisalina]
MTNSLASASHPARERGLGYAFLGGLGITVTAIIIGALAFAWLILAARGPTVPELLPADTQLYLAVTPNVGHVLEVAELRQILREELGISEHDALLRGVIDLAVVPLGPDNMGVWLGSELGVAIRGFNADTLAAAQPAEVLLRDAEILVFFGSKNDPQAEAFLEQHYAARSAQGEQLVREEHGAGTIYSQQHGPPNLTSVFTIIEHYVFFSNSRDALVALAEQANREAQGPSLAHEASFGSARPGRYDDGSAAAAAARTALSELLHGLMQTNSNYP